MSGAEEMLAEALTTLMHEQRLSYAQIAKPVHLARNTVRLVAIGKTLRPGELTLVKICVGLAVDPHYGTINKDTMTMALDRLGRASGHPELGTDWVRQTLPILLATIVGGLDTAAVWVELIDEQQALGLDEVRQLREMLSHHKPDNDSPDDAPPV